MRGVNKVILVGSVGRDPEIRALAGSGDSVATISVATSEQWKDKQSGERKEATEWHRVVFFGRLADIVGEYVSKGSKIYVEGKLTTRKWQDKNTGEDRYSTEIRADQLQLLDGKPQDGGDNQQRQQQGRQRQTQAQQRPADDFDDDLPF